MGGACKRRAGLSGSRNMQLVASALEQAGTPQTVTQLTAATLVSYTKTREALDALMAEGQVVRESDRVPHLYRKREVVQ